MLAISPVPREPATPAVLYRGALAQRMERGPTIARSPVPVVKEPQRISDHADDVGHRISLSSPFKPTIHPSGARGPRNLQALVPTVGSPIVDPSIYAAPVRTA